MDEPVAYALTFDDGNSSSLKSPVSHLDVGQYNVSLKIMDQENLVKCRCKTINVSDDSAPIPIISMNGMILTDNLSILTGQIIQFSAKNLITFRQPP